MSVTFSGESGVITQYLDGVRKKSETALAQELDGGGTLTIGESFAAMPYRITGFNLWDSVLPEVEIKDIASSCLKGIGNVKHWLQFSDKANSITAGVKVKAPSVCIPPEKHSAVEEPAESNE